jgi:hypothetical protein
MTKDEMYNFERYDVTSSQNDDGHDLLQLVSQFSDLISCFREAFTMYTSLFHSTATGVGGKEAKITGHGTVELLSECKGLKYVIHLKNVLHILGQKSNLISLG